MYCSNCGNQIPDNSKFCSHCGAQLQVVQTNYSAPAPNQWQQPAPVQQAQKPKKKKPNLLVTALVMLGAFLIGKFALAPAVTPDPEPDAGSNSQSSLIQSQGSAAHISSADYDAVFDGTYIVHFQSFFNMDMASYAAKLDNGIICCSDYGYENDVVKQWVETMYIPVSDYSDAEKSQLEADMRSQFAAMDALSCCTVSYSMSTSYLTITLTYTDVDQAANYGELYNAQLLQTNTFISMSATESGLLSQGFVKK